jgi:hypothetical protein
MNKPSPSDLDPTGTRDQELNERVAYDASFKDFVGWLEAQLDELVQSQSQFASKHSVKLSLGR